jgi:hypothetical protein
MRRNGLIREGRVRILEPGASRIVAEKSIAGFVPPANMPPEELSDAKSV